MPVKPNTEACVMCGRRWGTRGLRGNPLTATTRDMCAACYNKFRKSAEFTPKITWLTDVAHSPGDGVSTCAYCGRPPWGPRKTMTRGYCERCYTALRGRAILPVLTQPDLFWAKVDKAGPTMAHMDTGCWEWTGSRDKPYGYGRMGLVGRGGQTVRRAHVFSWTLANGPIPAGLFVCHHCDNPPCIRPDHLFVGTPKENTQDASQKWRLCHGTAHPKAKLNEDAVREIRRRFTHGSTASSLAVVFDVAPSTIMQVVTRKTWRHVAVH